MKEFSAVVGGDPGERWHGVPLCGKACQKTGEERTVGKLQEWN